MRIETTIDIDRPSEEVWAYISDPRHDPQWCDKVISVEQVGDQAPGPGARFEVMHRPVRLRRPKRLTVSVEDWDPPKQLRLREEDDDAAFNVTYRLTQTANGTMLRQVDEIQWKVPFPGPQIGRRMVQRDIERQFATLKQLLEGRSDE